LLSGGLCRRAHSHHPAAQVHERVCVLTDTTPTPSPPTFTYTAHSYCLSLPVSAPSAIPHTHIHLCSTPSTCRRLSAAWRPLQTSLQSQPRCSSS
jgi:hypothetical protein